MSRLNFFERQIGKSKARGLIFQSRWILVILVLPLCLLSACKGQKYFDQLANYSGYVLVSSVKTAQTTSAIPSGPGTLTLFDAEGKFVTVVKDYYSSSEYINGVTILNGRRILYSIEGTDRIEALNSSLLTLDVFSNNANLSGSPVRHMTSDSSGNVFLIENNGATSQIEKLDSTGGRVGAPFISTTTGSCDLSSANPFGITYIASTGNLAVTLFGNTSPGLYIYNANDGSCVSAISTSPFDSNYPSAIVYHGSSGKLLVGRFGDNRIYSVDSSGGSASLLLTSSRIGGLTALNVDSHGYVWVGSSANSTVEKLSFDGSALSFVSSTPIINTSIYSQNPTSVVVVP